MAAGVIATGEAVLNLIVALVAGVNRDDVAGECLFSASGGDEVIDEINAIGIGELGKSHIGKWVDRAGVSAGCLANHSGHRNTAHPDNNTVNQCRIIGYFGVGLDVCAECNHIGAIAIVDYTVT